MRNRYPGNCYRCGETVDAGAGHFERRRHGWATQHAECAVAYRGSAAARTAARPADMADAQRIQATLGPPCYRCGFFVIPGTGTTSRRRPGGWVTQHMTCATAYHGTDAEGVARPVDMADAVRIRDARAP